jgi:single-strand DNA-binding protein
MNKVVLLGRLTSDPTVRYTQTGKVVAQFILAVDRPFKDAQGNKETDFIPVVLWGKAAELVGNSCQKGHRLIVEGRIQIRNYEAKDGSKRWVTEIIANGVELVERKAETAKPSGEGSGFDNFGQTYEDMS